MHDVRAPSPTSVVTDDEEVFCDGVAGAGGARTKRVASPRAAGRRYVLREQLEHALKHVVDGRGEPAAGTPTNAVWELPEVRAPVDVPAHIEKGLQQFAYTT